MWLVIVYIRQTWGGSHGHFVLGHPRLWIPTHPGGLDPPPVPLPNVTVYLLLLGISCHPNLQLQNL